MYTLANINNPMVWGLILICVLVMFGGQKIPELMRGLGQGKRAFDEGLRGDADDELRKQKAREEEIRRRVEEEMRKEELKAK